MYIYIAKHAENSTEVFGGDSSDPWQAKFLVYSSFAQTAFGILLLIGGMLLLARKGSGRVLSAFSLVVVIGISIASLVIGYMWAKDLTGGDPDTYKLAFIWNPAFFWFDPEKMTKSSLESNFTIEAIAFGVLMVVSIAALIGALAAKSASRTAAYASAPSGPYGY